MPFDNVIMWKPEVLNGHCIEHYAGFVYALPILERFSFSRMRKIFNIVFSFGTSISKPVMECGFICLNKNLLIVSISINSQFTEILMKKKKNQNKKFMDNIQIGNCKLMLSASKETRNEKKMDDSAIP